MTLSAVFGLSDDEALAWFTAKGYQASWGWRDMNAAQHARAFTVAGVMKLDVLGDIHGALTKAMEEGRTFADFKRDLIPLLQAKGWWGRNAQTDPETGEMAGKGLTPRRLETVFRTNLQTAYNAGRYRRQAENAADRPWWMYVAILDGRTRPQHRALAGRVFRYDDPFWQAFYPPLGLNCRCRVRTLTEREVASRGLDTSISGKALQVIDAPDPQRPGQTIRRTRFEYAPGRYVAPDIGWDVAPTRQALWDRAAALPDCAWESPSFADGGDCVRMMPGQKTWKDFGRPDLRAVPASLRLASPGIIKAAATRELAAEVLAAELGLTAEAAQRVIRTPVETLVIWRDLLPHMVAKDQDARERYARFILPTLLDPYEVYLTAYDDGRIRPRYIGLFQGDRDLMCIVRRNRDGSFLWNLMQAKNMNGHRVGDLVYGK